MGAEKPVRRRRVEPSHPIPDYKPEPSQPPVKTPQPAKPEKVPA